MEKAKLWSTKNKIVRRTYKLVICLIVLIFILFQCSEYLVSKQASKQYVILNDLSNKIEKRVLAFKTLLEYGKKTFPKLNLKGADLQYTNRRTRLRKVDLQYAKLQGANLERSYLEAAKLNRANLEKANLQRAYLKGADLQNTKLQEADLRIWLEDVNLQGANLEGANMLSSYVTIEQILSCKIIKDVKGLPIPLMIEIREKNPQLMSWWTPNDNTLHLEGPYFQEANLQGVHLQSADLQRANLQGANLQGVFLSVAYLQEAYLQGANLQGTYLNGTDLQEANLQGANLQGAHLRFANLQGANLQGANLQDAGLRDTNLQGANLQGADLQGANLLGTPITAEQTLSCKIIKDVRGLSIPLMIKVREKNPELMSWWHEGMVKETDDDYKWTGRWIEPIRAKFITPKQISERKDIQEIKYLSKKFLAQVKELNPESMNWWHEDMVKETNDNDKWTGRWIEPTK